MDELNFEDLKNLSREELERKKLALDLSTYQERFELEKKATSKDSKRRDTWRLLMIAIVTAVVSLGSNYIIESYKSKSSRENEYFKSFESEILPIHSLSGAARQKAICNVAGFENIFEDRTIASALVAYNGLCDSIRKTLAVTEPIINNSDSIIQAVAKKADTSKSTEANAKKLDELERRLNQASQEAMATSDSKKRQDLKTNAVQLRDSIKTVINSDPLLKKANTASVTADSAFKTQQSVINQDISTPIGNAHSTVVLYHNSTWFKENYFLQFEDIKVLLQNLSPSARSMTVQICNMVGAAPCSNPIAATTVYIDAPFILSYGEFNYKLSLDRIGSAGANPFKPAAYVTFEKYKK